MAEQLVTKASKSFDNFKCEFCFERLEDPRMLACQHSFCTRCAERLIKKVDEKYTIKCPTCANITEISEGQVQKSILNILRSEMVLPEKTETKSTTDIPCGDCLSDDPAVMRCTTCCLHLCEICSQGHIRRKSTSNHKLVTLEDLQSSGPSVLPKPDLCHLHEGEEIRLYCETCEKTICRECAIVDHREHKYNFVKDVYTKEKEAVTQLLEETKMKQTLLRDALNSVVEMSSRVQAARKTVTQEINTTVDGFIQDLETGRKTLLQKAEDIEEEKLKKLEMQHHELEMAFRTVTSSIEFTEKTLRDGSKVEVLSEKSVMIDRMNKLNIEILVLEPCTDEVISYHSKPANQEGVINVLGRVSASRIEPSKCEVKTDNELDALKVLKEIKISIMANDQHGRAVLEPIATNVSVVIKSPNGRDNFQKLKVTNKDDGSYHGVYIPRVPGIYRGYATISGADILGSPFEWCVKDGVTPKMTTLQMEAGKDGVVYNTLVNQTRDFVIVTRDSKEQIREDGVLINVEIKEPNNLDPKVVPVQDCGDGRYTFFYKPVCVGNYQVSVKVNGNDIRGSPFTWGVEQWHLMARNRTNGSLIFSHGNMTIEGGRGVVLGSCGFSGGCHSWKVKVVSDTVWSEVGVTDSNVEPVQNENPCYWSSVSKRQKCNDVKPCIFKFSTQNDVIIYLDNKTLTVHNLASDKTNTLTVENTTFYPYFHLYNSKLTLLI